MSTYLGCFCPAQMLGCIDLSMPNSRAEGTGRHCLAHPLRLPHPVFRCKDTLTISADGEITILPIANDVQQNKSIEIFSNTITHEREAASHILEACGHEHNVKMLCTYCLVMRLIALSLIIDHQSHTHNRTQRVRSRTSSLAG